MQRIVPLQPSPLLRISHKTVSNPHVPALVQCLHTTTSRNANPLPITATGPPPAAPQPAASQYGERVDRRRRQAELLKRGQDMRATQMKPGTAIRKRFWKDVSVQKDDGMTDLKSKYLVNLDTRALRNPTTKEPLTIPHSKPYLATALALEWDLLVSAQQATRSHLIPLTSLSARAHVLGLEDGENQHAASSGIGIRYDIINTLLRYLDTDTLLCWAPESTSTDTSDKDVRGESLRDLQIRTARPILSYLTQAVWPGVELKPALNNGSILPTSQPAATRAVIKGWMAGLPAWELVGLERAVLAGKSLCVAARLVCEWSEYLQLGDTRGDALGRFGIEEATKACSQEVIWQTGRWGEVEDSHDVDKEDMKRQFGSVILAVSGTGNTTSP